MRSLLWRSPRLSMRSASAFVIFVLLVALAQRGNADPLPSATYLYLFLGNCFNESGTSPAPVGFSFSGACGIADLTGNLSAGGSIDSAFHADAMASVPSGGDGALNANVVLTYYVEVSLLPGLVLGQDVPNAPVPVLVSASGQVNCSSSDTGSTLSLAQFSVGAVSNGAGCLNGDSSADSFSMQGVLSYFAPNSPTVVQDVVLAQADTGPCPDDAGDCSASASATLDPVFQIDPTFQYASDFVLVYSPNLQVTSAVPEPRTAVCLSIITMLFTVLHRRRHVARVASYRPVI